MAGRTDMANHPNRNWRRRMHDAAEEHLARYRWPEGPGLHAMTPEQLREVLREAHKAGYLAGYMAGREAGTAPPRKTKSDTC